MFERSAVTDRQTYRRTERQTNRQTEKKEGDRKKNQKRKPKDDETNRKCVFERETTEKQLKIIT